MIYDCFIFFNELELLELRLMTLYDVVDYFVIVEVGQTFTGKYKEFYYENNKNKFQKYSDKIIHIKKDKLPFDDAWENEFYNRNLISEGIKNSHDDDYIIISDVDEIPNPESLMLGINNKNNLFVLEQKLFYYYVNCLQKQKWYGSVCVKKKLMDTPQKIRESRGSIFKISDGGWHYSFLGGEERIRMKLESYSETQTNNSDVNNTENILSCLEDGGDIFGRTDEIFKKEFINLENIKHNQLEDWLIKYPTLIKTTFKK